MVGSFSTSRVGAHAWRKELSEEMDDEHDCLQERMPSVEERRERLNLGSDPGSSLRLAIRHSNQHDFWLKSAGRGDQLHFIVRPIYEPS